PNTSSPDDISIRRSQSRVLSYSALPSEAERIRPQPAQRGWPDSERLGSRITRVNRTWPTERSLAKSSYGRVNVVASPNERTVRNAVSVGVVTRSKRSMEEI